MGFLAAGGEKIDLTSEMVIALFFALKLSIRVGGSPPTVPTPGGGALRFRTVMLLAETGPARSPPPTVAALTVAIESGDGCTEVVVLSDVRFEKGRFKPGVPTASCDLTIRFGAGRTFRTAAPAPPPPIVLVMTRSCLRPLRNDIAALLEPLAAAATVLIGGLLIAIRWPVLVIFVMLTLSDSGDMLVVAGLLVACNRPMVGLVLASAFGNDCCCCWLEMDAIVAVDGKVPIGFDDCCCCCCCCWRWASNCFLALAIARLLLVPLFVRVAMAPLELFIRC